MISRKSYTWRDLQACSDHSDQFVVIIRHSHNGLLFIIIFQPQSIHSQSSATGSSNGRNLHKKFTRYRMLHPTSTVDETLFGNNGSAEYGAAAQGSAPTNKTRQRRRSLSPKSASPQPDREYVRLVTKDLIRDLLYAFYF